MEQELLRLLEEYGYVILFLWSILEGEMGLVMGGILCHTGALFYPLAVLVAGLGGFTGDQIFFYVGRSCKNTVQLRLHKQKRKFAIAHLLLLKYGWPIIFVQRYLYGLRTVIPMAMGLTKYSARRFAFINFVSAMIWAFATITPAYYFGEEILGVLSYARAHWYVALPIAGLSLFAIYLFFRRIEDRALQGRRQRFAAVKRTAELHPRNIQETEFPT